MNGNHDTTDESRTTHRRLIDWVLTLAAVAGVVGAGLWVSQGERAVGATLLTGGIGLFFIRAQLDGLVDVVAPLSRVGAVGLKRSRAAARYRPDIETAQAVALVALVAVSVVGMQLAPVVLLDAEHDSVAVASPADAEEQDLTEYDQYDPNGRISSVSGSTVDFTGVKSGDDFHLNDYSTTAVDGDAEIHFTYELSSYSGSPVFYAGFTNSSLDNIRGGNRSGVGLGDAAGNNAIAASANGQRDIAYNSVSTGTQYFISVYHFAGNTTTRVDVYSDADRTNKLGSGSVPHPEDTYNYTNAMLSNGVSASGSLSGTISNFSVVGQEADVGTGIEYSSVEQDFEDEPADSGVAEDWADVSPDGSAGTFEVTTRQAFSGSQAYYLENTDSQKMKSQYNLSEPTTNDVRAVLWPDGRIEFSSQSTDGTEWLDIETDRNDGTLYANSGSTTLDTDTQLNEWIEIRVYNIDFAAGTYDVSWESPSTFGTAEDVSFDGSATSDAYDQIRVVAAATSGDAGYFDDIQIAGEGARLSGTVTDDAGNPIPYATVVADNGASTTTDDDGDYSLELDGGTYDITYDADAFDPQTIEVDTSDSTTQDVTLYKDGPYERTVGVCYEGGSQFQASTATAYWYEEYLADGRFTESNAPRWVRDNWARMLEDGVYQDDSTYGQTELHTRTEFNNRQNTTASGLVGGNGWYYDLQIATDRAYLQFDGYTPPSESNYTEVLFDPPFEDSAGMARDNATEADCPETTAEAPLNFSWTPENPQTNRSVRFAPDDPTHDNYTWTVEKSDRTVEREGRRRTAFWTEAGSYDVTLTATVNGERMSNTETIEVAQGTDISNDDDSEVREYDDYDDGESVSDYRRAYHAAEFEYSPENPDVNQSVAFEANGSASADSYSWDIAGDVTESARSVSYAFGEEDYHMVKLTATVNGTDATRYEFVQVGDGIPEAGGGGREEGWGPTAMGPCTTPDGSEGVYIEYWDPDYETEELSYQLEEGDAYHEGNLTFDEPKGYVFTCVASEAYDPENPEDTNATLSDGSQTFDANWSDRRGNEVGGTGGGGGGGGGFVPADAGSDAPLWLTAIPAAAAIGWAVLRRRRNSDGTGGSAGGGSGGSGGIGPF